MGIELTATAKGSSDSRSPTQRAVTAPMRMPAKEPMIRPATISTRV